VRSSPNLTLLSDDNEEEKMEEPLPISFRKKKRFQIEKERKKLFDISNQSFF
jgi:hypothetical protein